MKDHQPKLFLARADGSGEDETYGLDNGVAIIGYRDFSSLANARDYATVLALVKQADPDRKPLAAGNYAGQWWAFASAMQQVARVSAQRAPGAIESGRVSATDRDQKPRVRPAALPGLLAARPRPGYAHGHARTVRDAVSGASP